MTGEPPCCGAGFRFLFHREAGLRGGGGGSHVPLASSGGDCAAGRWFGGMQTGRALSALYAARSIVSCAAGRGPWRVGAESEGCALRRAGYHFLRGGTMVWQHADWEGVFSALRRAVCCVVTGPAGRCGYFSFSAYRRRQRKVPRKEARHSYFFERGSVQVHKSSRREAGTAAFLSASQTPKGKKSRPKERPWLPQERGKHCIDEFCVRRTGAAPRAPQSGAQGAAGSEASEV